MALLPPIAASALVIGYADLKAYQGSPLGRYVHRWMSPRMQLLRLAGYVVMFTGAWYHSVLALTIGLVIILLAWLRGIVTRRGKATNNENGGER